jgi:hypothetical protein
MRKHIYTRLKTLLAAACATLYTRQARAAKSKYSLEPKRAPALPNAVSAFDDWMFDTDAKLEAERQVLASEMNTLAESLSDLRETLALVMGETPYPVEAMTQTPCAIVHHDDILFDGEAEAPALLAQEDIIGGEGAFLFGDAPAFDEIPAQQAA